MRLTILLFIFSLALVFGCQDKKNVVQYYKNGSLELKGQLKNDKKIDLWEYYYSSGRLRASQSYNDGELYKETKFDKKGFKYYSYQVLNDQKEGVRILYQKNGKEKSRTETKNGLNNGHSVTYHKDGSVFIESFYSNDKLVREFKQYYKNGKKEVYSENAGNSIHTYWDSLGNKQSEILYKDFEPIDTVWFNSVSY